MLIFGAAFGIFWCKNYNFFVSFCPIFRYSNLKYMAPNNHVLSADKIFC